MKGQIYKVSFSDGTYYIGQTVNTFYMRYQRGLELDGSSAVVREKAKEGYEVDILAEGLSLDELNELEELILDEVLVNANCLNTQRGGGNTYRKSTKITLVSPEGVTHTFASGAEAARHIGTVTRKAVNRLTRREVTSAGGWTLPDRPKAYKGRQPNTTTLISPEGNVVTFRSQKEAAEHIGVAHSNVGCVCRGTAAHVKGWKLYNK